MRSTPSREKLEALLEAEGGALIKTAIERAKSGDSASLRMALDRLMPVRERTIKINLPPVESVNDLPKAIGAVVGSVSRGELAPTEGTALVGMLSAMRQSFELVDLAARLEAIERAMPAPGRPSGSEGYP
jgi:translation elongation factor EF-Tu-like GTPase